MLGERSRRPAAAACSSSSGDAASPFALHPCKDAGRGLATPATIEVPSGIRDTLETPEHLDCDERPANIVPEEVEIVPRASP